MEETPCIRLSSTDLEPSAFVDLANSFDRTGKHHVKLIVICSARTGLPKPQAILVVRMAMRKER